MPYSKLVSITNDSDGVVLRRWSRAVGELVCTHVGFYAPPSVTASNVGYYQDHGAPQDRLHKRVSLPCALPCCREATAA